MGEDAVGAAAVGDDLCAGGNLVEAGGALVDGDAEGAREVGGVVFLGGADVQDRVAARFDAGAEFVAADPAGGVAEVVGGGAFDVGDVGGGGVAGEALEGEDCLATADHAHSHRLVEDAAWLAALLHELVPGDPETAGLLALARLHQVRAGARFAPEDRILVLTANPAERTLLPERLHWT